MILSRKFFRLASTTTSYREAEIESKSLVLAGSGAGWNAAGMHYIDAHLFGQDLVGCVDGFLWQACQD
jgi:hypothetical protein